MASNDPTKNEKKPTPPSAPKASPPPAAATAAPPADAPTSTATTPKEPELTIDFEKLDARAQSGAKDAYHAYQGNANGKTHDGKPMPQWPDVGNKVRSHWAAVWFALHEGSHSSLRSENDSLKRRVADLESAIAEAASVKPDQALVVECERLKRELARLEASTGAVEARKIEAAVSERTTLLTGEVEEMRKKVAAMEREKAAGFKPWANRKRPDDEPSGG